MGVPTYKESDVGLKLNLPNVLNDKMPLQGEQMRVIAGVLMIIGALLIFMLPRAIFESVPGILGWLLSFWSFLVLFGGICVLKKKSWKFSLLSSILLLPIVSLPFLALADTLNNTIANDLDIPFMVIMTSVIILIGLFPLFSITAKKWEWDN